MKNLDSVSSIPNGLCIIDVYATWCGPCKKISPYFEELSKKFENITFLKADIEEVQDLEEKYGEIRTIPTFLFIKNTEEIGRVQSSLIDDIKSKIEQLKW